MEEQQDEEMRLLEAENMLSSAPYVNRIGIASSPGIVRMSFGEQWNARNPAKVRAAVAMQLALVKELHRILGEVIEDAESKDA